MPFAGRPEPFRLPLAAWVLLLTVALAAPAAAQSGAPSGKQILSRAMAWEVELTTTGGLMERGIGGIRLSSSGEVVVGRGFELDCRKQLDEATVSRIDRELSASRPDQWKPTYASSRDQKRSSRVTYRLKFTRKGALATSYETSWTDLELKRLPAPLATLVQDLNGLKASVITECQ